MTLLTTIQDAASQLGLRQPQAVFGSTDLTAQILLRFAQQEGRELAKSHEWQALTVEKTFTTLATVEQTNALPSTDYDRMAYNAEVWNRTNNQRYSGPTAQRLWQQLQNGITGGVTGWWRILGNELNIYPAPTAGQTLAFEYISKNWCESAGGTAQDRWEADTDVALLDEDLMTLGIVWRFRHSRGFPYAEDMKTYEIMKEKVQAQDRGTGRIRSDSNGSDFPPSPLWNGTIDG
jgi:hypothetical protein